MGPVISDVAAAKEAAHCLIFHKSLLSLSFVCVSSTKNYVLLSSNIQCYHRLSQHSCYRGNVTEITQMVPEYSPQRGNP